MARSTEEYLTQAPSLTSFIASRLRGTQVVLPEAVRHLAATILLEYIYEDIPVHTVLAWTQRALDRDIAKGPHVSECTTEMTALVRRVMRNRVRDGFSIVLPEADTVRFWGYNLNPILYCGGPPGALQAATYSQPFSKT